MARQFSSSLVLSATHPPFSPQAERFHLYDHWTGFACLALKNKEGLQAADDEATIQNVRLELLSSSSDIP